MEIQRRMKQNRGSVTLYVLIAMLFFVIILMGIYTASTNKQKTQVEAQNNIEGIYNSQTEEEAYNSVKDQMLGDSIGNGSWTGSVNSPKVDGTELVGVYWDESGNEVEVNTENKDKWYDYANQKWANAKSKDGSYWVWIPRYEYKIISGEGTATSGEIAINFIPTTINSKKGGVTTGYRIHPAFEDGSGTGKNNNFMNGEWDKELSGIWVAKFEASRSDSTASVIGTSNKVTIRPDVKSWTSIMIGECYTNSLNMFPIYNSHLMKNSEWGMAAYLTHSKYGRNMAEVTINANSNILTGGGNYKANTNQSTTGNATGIYDLSGGAWEQIAGYIPNGNSNLLTYGSSVVGTNTIADVEGYKSKSTKYVTIYPYNSSDSSSNNYTSYKQLKTNTYGYGDAILETSAEGVGITSWNEDFSVYAHTRGPFFFRGGNLSNNKRTGVFCFGATEGLTGDFPSETNSFRPVLCI